ncbi:hypothetical protein L5515_016671 [Caenorhabditis briggsae]|uniref:PHD-type domain-containing protein n=1 Tax=Caenorhabditis briggsae TaxID=6238 RepID=A0AAE9FCV4_CAEBR|nr:hypothetical protein L5515_016671 [Caenorhabditis briggsae]
MSTSFPNSNGSVPPYNPQANGSFNQYGGAPGGGYPGMDPYNIYAQPPNGYGGMPPGPPNMGGAAPPAAPPASSSKAAQQPQLPVPQQYPPAGTKLPAYDTNSMQNGYMNYPEHQPRPNGQPAQEGPPPNYNVQQNINPSQPHNPYAPVPDPYPHLHGGAPPYQGMPPSIPLQHYQPPGYTNGSSTTSTPARPPGTQAFPPLQPSKQAKQDESRPNNPAAGSTPNYPYGFNPFQGGPNGYPSYGPSHMNGGNATPGAHGQHFGFNPSLYSNQGQGPSTSNSAPGPNTQPHQPPSQTPERRTPNQSTPTTPIVPISNPYASVGGAAQGQFPDPSANYGGMSHSANPAGRATPGTPSTPTTPGSHHGTPGQQRTPQNNKPPPLYNQNTMTSPSHGPNGTTPQKQHPSPMGSSLPPLNGQYTPLSHNLQSPAATTPTSEPTFKEPAMPIRHSPSMPAPPSGAPPAYTAPSNSTRTPEASTASTSTQPTPPRAASPTFAVPALPATRTQASSSTNQVSTKPKTSPQKKRGGDESSGVPEPPSQDTPFTMVTHWDLPPAMTNIKDSLSLGSDKMSAQVEKQYFSRKRQPLKYPYPEGANASLSAMKIIASMTEFRACIVLKYAYMPKFCSEQLHFGRMQKARCSGQLAKNIVLLAETAPVTEPNTFGFIEGSKYFDKKLGRKVTCQPQMAPPVLSRSQSMHSTMVSPGFAAPQPPSGGGRQPAKKARSASDASEPSFNMPLPPSRQAIRPAPDPRQMQQMQQMQQMHQYQQMQMQKMHHQQQMAHMARMGQGAPDMPSNMPPNMAQHMPPNQPSTSTAGGISPAPLGSQLPPFGTPALQRAESMPALPSQQPPPLGPPMTSHMGGPGMPNGNPQTEDQTASTSTGNHRPSTNGLPPLTLRNPVQDGRQNHEYSFMGSNPSTSNSAPPQQEHCAGCHNFILPGSPTLLCMYHECKNRYHRECTRLSSIAFNHFSGTPQARWVCPTCEAQVRPPPPMPMQHA